MSFRRRIVLLSGLAVAVAVAAVSIATARATASVSRARKLTGSYAASRSA